MYKYKYKFGLTIFSNMYINIFHMFRFHPKCPKNWQRIARNNDEPAFRCSSYYKNNFCYYLYIWYQWLHHLAVVRLIIGQLNWSVYVYGFCSPWKSKSRSRLRLQWRRPWRRVCRWRRLRRPLYRRLPRRLLPSHRTPRSHNLYSRYVHVLKSPIQALKYCAKTRLPQAIGWWISWTNVVIRLWKFVI